MSVSPDRKECDTAFIFGVVSGKSAGGGCEGAKFSYLQPLEKAGNGEGIWQAVAPRLLEFAGGSGLGSVKK
jgi:hypothetical protein